MSAVPAADPASKSASKKKRKNKKKANDKNKPSDDSPDVNGTRDDGDDEGDEAEGDHDEERLDGASRTQEDHDDSISLPLRDGAQKADGADPLPLTEKDDKTESDTSARLDAMAKERDTLRAEVAEWRKSLETMQEKHEQEVQGLKGQSQEAQSGKETEVAELRKSIEDMQEKHQQHLKRLEEQAQETQSKQENAEVVELRKSLETMQERHQQEVAALKKEAQEAQEAQAEKEGAEVAQLRKSLDEMQQQHQQEVKRLKEQAEEAQSGKDSGDSEDLRRQLQEAQSGKENAETQYRTLLGKVNTIRSQLGERLKADAEELSKARSEIEDLQQQNRSARESQQELESTISKLQAEHKSHIDEIDSLRSRTSLSQSNWVKERDELISREAYAREEFENAKQAMQDWEVLAMEERSLRENLSDRVVELEEQFNAQREAYDRAASERDTQNSTVESLQRALQDIQDARKKELREMVESSQAQLDALRAQAEEAKAAAAASAAELEKTQKELERALPFEKEVKEKNLLIGKLRHEAVILNDHLTKALRFLKRGKPEDNVDRQIVTNHFLHFLALDRSDPKKFQILQLIAALLNWTEEQKEQAGLARPGASNSLLRVPLSPFRRTPSTPALTADLDNAGGSKESLAELWSEFLEREAQEGGRSASASRSGSFAAMGSPNAERPGSAGLGIKGSGTPGS